MQRVKLGDVAIEYKANIKSNRDKFPSVGLEHIDPEEINLTKWSEGKKNTFTKMFKKGHILFGRRRSYLKKAAIAPFDGICSGDITVIEAKKDRILPELLPFIIQNDTLFAFAESMSAGSLSPRVKWEYLKAFEFDLPELEEQKKLAAILWAANDAKEAYNRLLDVTDELIKSKFIEMFGDPGTNPLKWEVCSFDEFASIDGKMTKEYDKYAEYPHIGIDSIEKETGRLVGYRTVKEDSVISPKYIFTSNHIIYSKIRPILNKVALPDFDGLCSADAYPILPNYDICNRVFLATAMRSSYFMKYIHQFSARSHMPKVNRKQLSGFKMPLPPLELQDQFADFIKRTDKSKSALQQSISAIEKTIKSLMNQYIV